MIDRRFLRLHVEIVGNRTRRSRGIEVAFLDLQGMVTIRIRSVEVLKLPHEAPFLET